MDINWFRLGMFAIIILNIAFFIFGISLIGESVVISSDYFIGWVMIITNGVSIIANSLVIVSMD